MKLVAILMTCHNRVEKTLYCLRCLENAVKPEGYEFYVYLVDDGSTDNTGESVKIRFPEVTVIEGGGNLFWCGGMRKAWNVACENEKKFDFFIWLNDDTYLYQNALELIFEDFKNLKRPAIIVGAVSDPYTGRISYSGYSSEGSMVIPSGRPQKCLRINGNFVLVPFEVREKIGILSEKYSHGIGDADYSLRAKKGGFHCYVGSVIFGECEENKKKDWFDPTFGFQERVRVLFSKTGGNILEYLVFKKDHYGLFNCLCALLKTVARLFFPKAFS